jgi:hypothetical protein
VHFVLDGRSRRAQSLLRVDRVDLRVKDAPDWSEHREERPRDRQRDRHADHELDEAQA